jgi:ParB family chromosome partitioning protein
MNRTSLPLTSIIVEDRQRECKPEAVASLAESMKTLGLIQPIVINQHNRLIAGGHRLAAARFLGWESIDVVYRETMSEGELQELELTENVKRSDLTWQERCIAIAKIHALKQRSAALDSKTWGQKETGAMLNVSQGYISYVIIVSRILLDKPKDHEIWKCESLTEAWSLVMRWQSDEAMAHLSAVKTVAPMPVFTEEDDVDASGIFNFTSEPKPIQDPHHGDTLEMYDQITGKKIGGTFLPADVFIDNQYKPIEIALSSHYIKCDSIKYMTDNPGRFDHIITDIPYGIDIDNLDQTTGIKDIATIKDEHTVEGNLQLFDQFFSAGFWALKENAFLITWCDIMNWQYMYDRAIAAGFKVQRWPITWSKPHGLNQMAQFNFTKTTEIAMVCRKGLITLVEKQPTCVIEAGRDALCESINHPFAKPYACWFRLISAVSIKGQSILDPFCGRGSSFIAGTQMEREMYGCEIQDAHYNAGLENIKQFHLNVNPKSTFV